MSGQLRRKKRQLLERDGTWRSIDGVRAERIYRCYLCLKEFLADELEIEHKTPTSRGGSNNLRNLGLSCEPCNIEKANMTVEEYIEWRKLTPAQKKRSKRYEGRLSQPLKSYWPNKPGYPDASYAWPETEALSTYDRGIDN